MTSKPDKPNFILNAKLDSTDAIKHYASKYEECAREQNANEESHWNEETKLIELCECIKKRGWLKKDDLYRLAKWKSRLGLHYQQQMNEYESNRLPCLMAWHGRLHRQYFIYVTKISIRF